MNEPLTVTVENRRRVRYLPRPDGRVDMVEESRTHGDDWREVGHQIVDSVDVTHS